MVFQAPITSSDWFRASAALAVLTLASTLAHAAPVWNVNIGSEITTSDNFAGAAPENTAPNSFWNSVTTATPSNQALSDSTGAASAATLTLTPPGPMNFGGHAPVTGLELFSTWIKTADNSTPFTMTIRGLSSSKTYDLIIYSDWYWKGNETFPVTQTVGTGLSGTVTLDQISSGTNGIVPSLVEDTNPAANSSIEGNWIRIKGLIPAGGYLAFNMGGTNAAFSGFQLIETGEGPPDTAPPTPDPAAFAIDPIAADATSITMTAVTASDPSGVEYYFDETTGNPGGTDSGWQDSPSYTDTGLTPGLFYTYRVQARDKSVNHNATAYSGGLSSTTLNPPGGAVLANLAATSITQTSATLGGQVASIGNGAPSLTLFWGTTDGGVSPSSWQNSINLPGTHSENFSVPLSGLAVEAAYYFTFRATNSAGTSWASASGEFDTLPPLPTVSHLPVMNLRATAVDLTANVGGGTPADLTFFYGASDGGTDAGAWASSVSANSVAGVVTVPLSGLAPATTYHFRAFAANAGGAVWAASSGSFQTRSLGLPSVSNRSADGITTTTANLRGEVTNDGNDPPLVTIFYGTADGGDQPTAWAASISLGIQQDEFSGFVGALVPGNTYFFRCRATNAAGTAWASASASFTTEPAIPNAVVINEFHYKPADPTSPEEFIELHNPGATAIDLSGWTVSDAISYIFPGGTVIPAGGFVVVGENPATLLAKFGVSAHGPWTGSLNSSGERIDLRDAGGVLRDRVSYGVGFPWPTAAAGGGFSAELIHPSLDNDLGGSWRSNTSGNLSSTSYVAPESPGWRYRKGTVEASSPVDAWRAVAFNDSSWLTGQAPFGVGTGFVPGTTLTDMVGSGTLNYRSVYARKTFTVPAGEIPRHLKLKVRIDDACVVWINGAEVYRTANAGSGQLAYNFNATSGVAGLPTSFTTIDLADPPYLIGGTNVLAIHAFNRDSDSNRGDCVFEAELVQSQATSQSGATPGFANRALSTAALIPPQIRQVAHAPADPAPAQPVTITARITDPDGMGAVSLSYQTVDPGTYIRLTDAAYQTAWTSIPMNDAGSGGDAVVGDSVFTATLPASLQTNRRLVRYRITFADSRGNTQTVPYADDEQPNFAFYVYGGLPDWQGALRPGETPLQTVPSTVLDDVPVYSLIANGSDVINSQYVGSSDGVRFFGSFVHDGIVHDHIQFRNRGEISTYITGKNKWRFYFNRSRDLPAKDHFGQPYKETWGSFSANACASPWAALNRGMAGLDEAVPLKAFGLCGVPSPNSHYYHFRVVRGEDETPDPLATVNDPIGNSYGQYAGDFWGLYMAVEDPDGSFLDERGLPDGNIYKIEGSAGDKKHQSATQAVDSSDWDGYRDAHFTVSPTEAWWRANLDLEAYHTFHAINRLTGNIDLRGYSNHYYYHRTTDNRWVPIPWDLDMMFIAKDHNSSVINGANRYGVIYAHRAILEHPAIALEHRNRLREIVSLIASDPAPGGGQIGQLIDELAQFVNPTGVPVTLADADAAMWNLHPRTLGTDSLASGVTNHRGNFWRTSYADDRIGGSWTRWLRSPAASGTMAHEDSVVYLRDYATNAWPGGVWAPNNGNQLGYGYQYLRYDAADAAAPAKPVITFSGASGFPVSNLAFTSGAYSDPQGPATHSATQWRIAEIQGPGVPGWTAGTPRKYEIAATHDSGPIGTGSSWTVPLGVTEPGRTYRARVRHRDNTGRWSYWSDPVEFSAGQSMASALLHYWNFNDSDPATNLPVPTQTAGGAGLSVTGIYESGTGQSFSAANAHLGDAASSHLRVNNPLTAGTNLLFTLPTTGFTNIVVKYETRRSGQGAGTQTIGYTTNGTTYQPFGTLTIVDDMPEVKTLDFRALAAVSNNPTFGLRVTFAQGTGGTAGNNRFDNLTVEGVATTTETVLIPNGDATWNFAENWTPSVIPDAAGTSAVILAPGAVNREVDIASAVTVGSLEFRNGASTLRNRLQGAGLIFDGGLSPALLRVSGTGSGFTELEVDGGTTLTTNLKLEVNNITGDPTYGTLRLRSAWSGPGGLIKQGPGMAALTGELKSFTGQVLIEAGVLSITESSAPAAISGLEVQPGGQLRLVSGSVAAEERVHTLGGIIQLAGYGRSPEIPDSEQNGKLGALRYDPDSGGTNNARITNSIHLVSDADLHVDGPTNTLILGGSLSGAANISKSGGGRLVLAADSPSYAGTLTISNGPLVVNAAIPAMVVSIGAGQSLSGTGRLGSLSGTGSVDVGNSVLTATTSSASRFTAVLANLGSAGNGMLRLTSATPLGAPPQTVEFFLKHPQLSTGQRFQGGIFADAGNFSLTGSDVRIFLPDPAGSVTYEGQTYRTALPEDQLSWAIVTRSLSFASGPASGAVIEILVGGEPTLFSQWQGLNFADLSNPLVSAPNATPLGDGIANLIRYAHGAGLSEPVAHLLPRIVKSGGGFVYRFRHDATKTDIAWQVRATDDPGAWPHVIFDTRTDPIPPLIDGWLEVPAPSSLGGGPTPAPRMFLRLGLEQLAP